MSYFLFSDPHFHNWSQFSETDEKGINTRLQDILGAFRKIVASANKNGVERLYCAGDIFHVRGKVAPSVMNPVLEAFREAIESGVEIRVIPGNHDLENKESDGLGNATRALKGIGVVVCDEITWFRDDKVVMFPWFSSPTALLEAMRTWYNDRLEDGADPAMYDAIIHAPVNGVIWGIPDHGLDPETLAGVGFHRVFAGHYHDHRVFEDGKVVSIGALTHQTWSDVGTKAGCTYVGADKIKHLSPKAPRFVDLTDAKSEGEIRDEAAGNFVKVKVELVESAAITKLRQGILDYGARGVIIQAVPKPTEVRRDKAIKTGASVEKSIEDFIKSTEIEEDLRSDVSQGAQEIFAEAKVA